MWDRTARSEAIVIGSGIAGLTAALRLAPLGVTVLSKTALVSGATPLAQGGVAAALGVDDSPCLHAADTLAAADGVALADVVDVLTHGAPGAIEGLTASGVAFDRASDGRVLLGREAAHSRPRIVHAGGDATGAAIARRLAALARAAKHVAVAEESFAIDLAMAGGRVVGVLARERTETVLYLAPAVVIATGGIGQLYRHTTNPLESTGDGLAMAARAGARLADLEFVQFHPTALDVSATATGRRAASNREPLPLLTEALRGEGAVLVDESGRRFMSAEHPLGELAPRDIVARAIWRQQEAGHEVRLDARRALGSRFASRFPTAFASCTAHGVDPRREPVPVTPAAHFHMGGIAVSETGRTSLPGLWACGESAASGVHGANRLASNSLLEGLVFGALAARDIREAAWRTPDLAPEVERSVGVPAAFRLAGDAAGAFGAVGAREARAELPDDASVGVDAAALLGDLRSIMWSKAGLIRDAAGLAGALSSLRCLALRPAARHPEIRNMLTTATLVAAAALARTESRGAHARSDFPDAEARWQRRLYVTLTGPDGLELELGETIPAPRAPVRKIA